MATNSVMVNFRLDPKLHERLQGKARSEHKTVTAVLAELIEAYLKRPKAKAAA